MPTLPSDVDAHVSIFDRFAGATATFVARAPFFAACVLLIVMWAPTVLFLPFNTWQLLINTITTIVTFLLVALVQNSQTRADQATQVKLNAIADALADFMEAPDADARRRDASELRAAVGLEARTSS